jgi:lipoprotein NlpI
MALLWIGCAMAAGAAAYDDFAAGMAANMRGDSDAAIAAFTTALSAGDLSPGLMPTAYRGRGSAYLVTGRCGLARADFEAALALRPGDGALTVLHANAARCDGKPDLALADYAALIAKQYSPDIYRERAWLRWRRGDLAGAIADFVSYAAARPKDAYGVLWLEMLRARAGTLDAATTVKDIAPFDGDDWPGPLLGLYAGTVRPEALAAAAARGDAASLTARQCEADFYLAEWHLSQGGESDAKPLLQSAAERCPHNFVEYDASRLELRRINGTGG